jgi:REP element-mobilizing transposase RayT
MDNRDRPGHVSLRRGRIATAGHVYLVTTATREREPVFADVRAAQAVAHLHVDATAFLDATMMCWVLMPDHWHGLVRLGQRHDLSRVMQRFKSRCSWQVNRVLGRDGALWQPAFHDRALRDQASCNAAARYILDNPVRAGLCSTWEAYPWSGISWVV